MGDPDEPPSNSGAGKALLIAGLASLVVLISFFLCTTLYVRRSPRLQVPGLAALNMRLVFVGLYLTTGLLLLRNIFRVVEFSQGWCAPLPLLPGWQCGCQATAGACPFFHAFCWCACGSALPLAAGHGTNAPA